jgi:formylglycine-generating enzyme required for sulfatase activity
MAHGIARTFLSHTMNPPAVMKHLLLTFLLLHWAFVHTAAAADRVALVIGNNHYAGLPESMQLTSPVNDAQDVAAQLVAMGYTLITGKAVTDASRDAITTATEQFATAARGAEAAVFYFSGHGIQVGEDNYLLPTDTPNLTGIATLNNRTVLLRNSVMVALEEAGAKTKVIILDCCRDNPFAAQLSQALAQVGKSVKTKSVGEITGYGPGFYLAFATSPGQTAADGNGARNSPFTAAMLQALPTGAAKDIDFYFREVKAKLPSDQVSWTNHSLHDSFSLAPGGAGAAPLVNRPLPVPPVSTDPFANASKNTPFINSLGMKFVPAASQSVLFSVWETRMKDFEAFVEETGHDAIGNNTFGKPAYTLERGSGGGTDWLQKGGSWRDPRFPTPQTSEHPVVCVSYLDAEAFCEWLTKKERAIGQILNNARYRLPTDSEWSRACGPSKFPWGDKFPPNSDDGNYSGKEAMVGVFQGFDNELSRTGRRDSASRTMAVGMLKENLFGLHDMGGNVWEWCGTWFSADLVDAEIKKVDPVVANYKGSQVHRVLRGGSWCDFTRIYMSSGYRFFESPRNRTAFYGFRIVLAAVGS